MDTMDCSRTSLPDSGPSTCNDTNRLLENSTVEPKSKSLNDTSNKENKVRKRMAYSKTQLQELHFHFKQNEYLNSQQMDQLSKKLGITHRQVRKWFQNMRMKKKKHMNISDQESHLKKICDQSIMNPNRTRGIMQSTIAQPTVTFQQESWTNTTFGSKMEGQSCNYFSHLHKQQKTAELSNCNYHQPTAVPTYANSYLDPTTFQQSYGMDQSWNMISKDIFPQQQNRGNHQAGLLYDRFEVNSMPGEPTVFMQL